MAVSVTLPELGESVTEGTVTRWLKQPGDSVEVDEPLLEVSTDKVDTEIPSPAAGKLLEIKVNEDETVEVGTELATIGEDGEAPSSGGDESGAEPAAEESDAGESDAGEQEQREDSADRAEDSGDSVADDASAQQEQPSAEQAAGGASGGGGGGSGQSVTLPELGESVTEGTVTRWLKQVGDSVEVDEPLLEISTDKVDTEVPSPYAGTLLEIKVGEDETVEVGGELAVIGEAGAEPSGGAEEQPKESAEPEQAPAKEEQAEEPTKEAKEEQAAEPAADESTSEAKPAAPAPAPAPAQRPSQGGQQGDGKTYVTPLVRKLAAEHDIDLSTLTGSGVGGRIRKQDVLEAAKAKEQQAARPAAAPAAAPAEGGEAPAPVTPSPLRGKTEKLSRLRKVIAKNMVESLQVSAQLTTVVEIDVTKVARLREANKAGFLEREGVKLSFLPFFAKATVDALKQYPQLNATLNMDEGTVTYHGTENLGMAVDTESGLIVPVVKDAGDLSVAGLARKIADLADRTRSKKITPDDLSGGTFTLTNTGSRGALFDTPIINQPQVGILGTGSVVKRPVVIDDPNLGETIAVRNMVYFALTYDHRIIDGADAARFLGEVKQRLESGQFEV